MGLFKEEGVDVLDLTLLKKKGILKIKEAPREGEIVDLTKTDREGFAPLVNMAEDSSTGTASGTASTGGTTFASFWDAPVSATPASLSSADTTKKDGSNNDFSNLAVKIDNLEYKVERLMERLSAIESKINNL